MSRDHNLLDEVVELQTALKAQEEARARVIAQMQKNINVLKASARAIGDSDSALREDYESDASAWAEALSLVESIPCRPT